MYVPVYNDFSMDVCIVTQNKVRVFQLHLYVAHCSSVFWLEHLHSSIKAGASSHVGQLGVWICITVSSTHGYVCLSPLSRKAEFQAESIPHVERYANSGRPNTCCNCRLKVRHAPVVLSFLSVDSLLNSIIVAWHKLFFCFKFFASVSHRNDFTRPGTPRKQKSNLEHFCFELACCYISREIAICVWIFESLRVSWARIYTFPAWILQTWHTIH